MKSFNLATNIFFRKLIGFILIGLGIYFTIDKINTNLEVLMFLFGITFGSYFVLEYASYGSNEYVTIDFRSEEEKVEQEATRKYRLLEAAKENLILEVAQGNISRSQLENRLESLLFLEKQFESNKLLASPLQEDYV